MSKLSIRKAKRSEAKPLIGLYSESGGGKTKTALLLAKGYCGDMAKVCMVETEAGRGEAWADDPEVGGYQVIPIRGEFPPAKYGEAISAAEAAGVSALIIDSASHEWEGAGGVLAMAAENQAAGKKGPIVWQQPKMQHQREFMLRLMQTPIPLVIVCMRAKYPMEEKIINKGPRADYVEQETGSRPPSSILKKEWVKSTELSPKQAEDILYEMFVHGWLDKETHSFHGTKYTLEELRSVIKDGEPISADTGKRLAAWAKGNAAPQMVQPTTGTTAAETVAARSADAAALITTDQAIALEDALAESKKSKEKLLSNVGRRYGAKIERLAQIRSEDYADAMAYARGA